MTLTEKILLGYLGGNHPNPFKPEAEMKAEGFREHAEAREGLLVLPQALQREGPGDQEGGWLPGAERAGLAGNQ